MRSSPMTVVAGLAVALLAGTCSKAVSYTYVDVDVTIDTATLDATHQYLITSCEFFVTGADDTSGSGMPLRCQENNVPIHVGRFQWTSEASSGALQFTVKLFDANHVTLGSGTSDSVPISPGKHLETSVLVLGVDNGSGGGGTGGAAGTGGAPGTGGASGTGGKAGTGGATGTGGGTAGMTGTAGSTGSAGAAGTAGAGGTG